MVDEKSPCFIHTNQSKDKIRTKHKDKTEFCQQFKSVIPRKGDRLLISWLGGDKADKKIDVPDPLIDILKDFQM